MTIQIAVSARAVIMNANRVHRVRDVVLNQVVFILEIALIALTLDIVAWVKILMICKKVVLDPSETY
jgi:hypothetical protein